MAAAYESDPGKAAENLRKHGVSFDEAVTVFSDPLSLMMPDEIHSSPNEARFITMGCSNAGRLLVVVYCPRADMVRLISARKPTKRERILYEEGI